MANLGLLVLRLVAGGLLAGHGAQKLFGWSGGHGLEGTAGWLEAMGLRPGRYWALGAGLSEFGGGLLTALGFLSPAGPLAVMGAMAVAWGKAHWGKPIWATSGGGEFPLTNIAIATALALAGPGRYSLDAALGTRLPRWLVAIGAVKLAIGVAYAVTRPAPQVETPSVGAPPVAAADDSESGEEATRLRPSA
jgi:putative oxidoreductase